MNKRIKILADIPWIDVLMCRVRGVTGKLGYVSETYRKEICKPDDPDGMFTVITWEDGTKSMQRHYLMTKVELV